MDKLSLIALARNGLDDARRASSGRSAKTVHGGHDTVPRQTVRRAAPAGARTTTRTRTRPRFRGWVDASGWSATEPPGTGPPGI